MNEFTIEELEKIFEVLAKDPWELHSDLLLKIKYMIDNYKQTTKNQTELQNDEYIKIVSNPVFFHTNE